MKSALPAPDDVPRSTGPGEGALRETSLNQAYEDFTKLAMLLCGAPFSWLILLDGETPVVQSVSGLDPRQVASDAAFLLQESEGKDLLVVKGAGVEQRTEGTGPVGSASSLRFRATASLVSRLGRRLGVLCVGDLALRELSPSQQQGLLSLSRQLVNLIELRGRTTVLETEKTFADVILDASNSLVTVLDRFGNVVRANQACAELSGLTHAEAKGRFFGDLLLDEKNRKLMKILFTNLKPNLFPSSFENEWITRKEGARRIAWNNNAILNAEGAVEYVVCVGIDITDKRRAERDFNRVFDMVPDFICTLDSERKYARVNLAFARFLGVSPEAIVGKSGHEFIHPEEKNRIEGLRKLAVGQGLREVDLRFRRHDGVYRWLSWSVSPPGPDGYAFACARDVTERKEIEQLKDEFVSTVSHELRTPLTAIRGALGLLEGGVVGELPAEALDLVQLGRFNCERLVRLINDILDLEKIEAGKIDLNIKPVNTASVMCRAVEGMQPLAAAASVKLTCEVDQLPDVLADEDRFVQVLVNLVSNAIKFSPPDGSVTVRAFKNAPGRIRITVFDEGPGIPPDKRGLLFKRFSQVDSSDSRRKGGTGLGLAISRAIVERHGGDIGADALSKGSAFWFELPTAPRISGLLRALDPIVTGARLLVVEDDNALAVTMRELLIDEGYVVDLAGTLAEARRAIETHRPSALILDVHLPDGDGVSFVDELHRNADYGTIPILIISGQQAPSQVSLPIVMDWIAKPFDAQTLRDALARAVPNTARPIVLLVDDDSSFRQVLGTRLRAMGLDCIEVGDGTQALEAVRSSSPDLIVLDVDLPGADGFNVVEALRQEGSHMIPLIVYTGRDLTAAERRTLTLGVTRHLTKARATEEEFVGAVRSLLTGSWPPAKALNS